MNFDLHPQRVATPPTSATPELFAYLRDLADAINSVPRFSIFSAATPNSLLTALPGTIAVNLLSTATTLWVKQLGSGNTGWDSIATA